MKIKLFLAVLLFCGGLNAQVLNLRTSPKGDSISINASEIKRIAASGSGSQIWFSANSQLVMETPSAISAASCEAFIVVNIPGTVYIGKKFIVKVTKSGTGAKIFTNDGFADITTTTPYWEVIEQTVIPAECGGAGGSGIAAIEFDDRDNGISGSVSNDSILSLFLDPNELPSIGVAPTDSVIVWDSSEDTVAVTSVQSIIDLVATSSTGAKIFRSTDNFATFSPSSPAPVNGDFCWDTRRGNLWQRSGGSFTTRVTYENGSLASTAFSTTNDTLLFDASLYNRAQLITPTSGTTIVVSAPTNIASQAVGEVFQIIIQNSNDSTATVNWNAVFGKWDMTSVTTTVTAGTTIGYLWQTVTDGAEGVVLASLNDLGGGNPTGAAGGDLTGTYPNPTIAANVVDSTNIPTGGVGNTDLAAGIVTASKIAADAVGNSKMADNAIGAAEIINESVGSSEIDTGAVGSLELASDVVDSTKAAGLAPGDIYFDANGSFPQIIVGFTGQGGVAQSQDGAGSQVSFNSSSPTGKYNLQVIDGTIDSNDIASNGIAYSDLGQPTKDSIARNFATANLTATANRTHLGANKDLTFSAWGKWSSDFRDTTTANSAAYDFGGTSGLTGSSTTECVGIRFSPTLFGSSTNHTPIALLVEPTHTGTFTANGNQLFVARVLSQGWNTAQLRQASSNADFILRGTSSSQSIFSFTSSAVGQTINGQSGVLSFQAGAVTQFQALAAGLGVSSTTGAATSTATQKDSRQIQIFNNMWNGSAAITSSWNWISLANTSVNEDKGLVLSTTSTNASGQVWTISGTTGKQVLSQPTGSATSTPDVFFHLNSASSFLPPKGSTGDRPSASGATAGASRFNTTIGLPEWSDGTNWNSHGAYGSSMQTAASGATTIVTDAVAKADIKVIVAQITGASTVVNLPALAAIPAGKEITIKFQVIDAGQTATVGVNGGSVNIDAGTTVSFSDTDDWASITLFHNGTQYFIK